MNPILERSTLHAQAAFPPSLTGGSRVRNPEKAAEKLLHAMDFQYQSLTREQAETRRCAYLRLTDAARRPCARQPAGADLYGRLHLTAVEGTFYTGGSSITRVSEQEAISAADALAQLLARRDALGWVGSTVTSSHAGRICRRIRRVPVSALCRSGWSRRTPEASLSTALRAKSRRKNNPAVQTCRIMKKI